MDTDEPDLIFTTASNVLLNVASSVAVNFPEKVDVSVPESYVKSVVLFCKVVIAVELLDIFDVFVSIWSNLVPTSSPCNVKLFVILTLGTDKAPVIIPPDFFRYRASASLNVIPSVSPFVKTDGLKIGKSSIGGK